LERDNHNILAVERKMRISLLCRAVFALTAFVLASPPSWAEAVADFYKGKTVSIILSSGAGGGYDALARTLAPYLANHIPGNPTVIVKNMAGAGGLIAANNLYNVAAKDGTVIGGVQNNIPFEPLFGNKAAQFDATKFYWLGTPSIEVALLTVSGTTPVNTWQDVKTHEILMGSSGVSSTPSFYGRLARDMLGLKIKLIVGYESQTTAFLAMERGEIDGYPSVFYSSLMSTKPTWIKDKKVKLLLEMGLDKEKEIPDVPFLLDLLTKTEDKQLATAAFAPLATGRPYLLPPGVPEDRAAAMRKAFTDTFNDPAFVADANQRGLGVNSPRSGEELQALIERVYKTTPQPIVERIQKMQTTE
jgi:tripartite-type tricarboxylate transporter receptor subunit TctC